jgi:ABC-type dipeptide/oligopeptide/nickel transport system permease subunit
LTEGPVQPLIEPEEGPLGKAAVLTTLAEGGEVPIAGGWRLAVREFADNRIAVAGVGILVFFVLFCFIGPLVHDTNQSLTQPLNASLAPGATSPLGGHAGILGTDVWAARVMGSGRARLVYKHLIPNALSVVIVNVTFLVADSILALGYLGFLGFGLQYPAASWGDMLGNADTYISDGQWWLAYPVGFCLVAVVLACNLIGDALRDALDVRLRRR